MGATHRGFARLGLITLGVFALAASSAAAQAAAEAAATVPSTMAASEDVLSLAPPLPTKASAAGAAADPEVSQLAQMDLEGLMQLEITTGTLTRTQRHLVPAAITVIDRQDINNANPRDLTELLDIYVPNLHWEYAMWEPLHIGIRGIISDREDKYLLLVNSRVQNERTHSGALAERDLLLFGDLERIDVIRGPGSAVYGPGAISGVVSLQTYSGLTYQGTEINVRGGGFWDEFAAVEFKHGGSSDPKAGYFVYAGVAKQNGADREHTPVIQGQDFTSPYGTVRHGHPVPYPFNDLDGSYKGNPQVKLHAQVDADGFTFWTRYSYGGQNLTTIERAFYAPAPVGWGTGVPPVDSGFSYQQLTAFAGYKGKLTDKIGLELSTSFDVTEFELSFPVQDDDGNNTAPITDTHTEDKWVSRAMLHFDPTPNQQLAAGVEYAHFWLGLPSWRSHDALADRFTSENADGSRDMPRWQTDLFSLIAEHQWHINDQWTTFLSMRADKHTFTDWMYSPRAAIAYAPNQKDTFKFIASQSVRTNFEEEMKIRHDLTGKDSDPEKARTLELRYERQQNPNLFLAGSVFYNHIYALGWDDNAQGYGSLGTYGAIGVEGELIYHTDDTRVTFSHGIVKLTDIDFDDGVFGLVSARSVGYGNDLANWPSMSTKLTLHQQFSRKWSGDASLRVDWGFPGDKDFERFRNDFPPNGPGTPTSSVPNWNEPYYCHVLLNLGLEHQISENMTLRFDAYNVLGWIDGRLNKREFLGPDFEGEYREAAPAVGISFRYTF